MKLIDYESVAPAWALADMLKREGWGTCGLWPDDLDLEVTAQDEADWRAACLAFGTPATRLIDQAQFDWGSYRNRKKIVR